MNVFFFNFILFLNFTILYRFCQISKWIRHRYTCVPHPEPSSLPIPSLRMYFLTPSIWLFCGVLYITVSCTCTFAVHGVGKSRTLLSDWIGVLYIKITSIPQYLGPCLFLLLSYQQFHYSIHKKSFFKKKTKQQWTDGLNCEK